MLKPLIFVNAAVAGKEEEKKQSSEDQTKPIFGLGTNQNNKLPDEGGNIFKISSFNQPSRVAEANTTQ